MPKFPRKESDIFSLVYDMLMGYQGHPEIFPHVDIHSLLNRFNAYNQTRTTHIQARSFLVETTETKNISLELLTQFATAQLKRSEADCAANPENLKYIGWDARTKPSSQNPQPPGQPRNLSLKTQSPDTVILDWKPPHTASARQYATTVSNGVNTTTPISHPGKIARSLSIPKRSSTASPPAPNWNTASPPSTKPPPAYPATPSTAYYKLIK